MKIRKLFTSPSSLCRSPTLFTLLERQNDLSTQTKNTVRCEFKRTSLLIVHSEEILLVYRCRLASDRWLIRSLDCLEVFEDRLLEPSNGFFSKKSNAARVIFTKKERNLGHLFNPFLFLWIENSSIFASVDIDWSRISSMLFNISHWAISNKTLTPFRSHRRRRKSILDRCNCSFSIPSHLEAISVKFICIVKTHFHQLYRGDERMEEDSHLQMKQIFFFFFFLFSVCYLDGRRTTR